MSRAPHLTTLAVTSLAAFILAALVMLSPASVRAGQGQPRLAGVEGRVALDPSDELAALEAVQVTLTEVPDGSTFVWYRANGRLSGQFRPTASFRNAAGQVCRHLIITLSAAGVSRQREGMACRDARGVWSLEG